MFGQFIVPGVERRTQRVESSRVVSASHLLDPSTPRFDVMHHPSGPASPNRLCTAYTEWLVYNHKTRTPGTGHALNNTTRHSCDTWTADRRCIRVCVETTHMRFNRPAHPAWSRFGARGIEWGHRWDQPGPARDTHGPPGTCITPTPKHRPHGKVFRSQI